MKIYLDNIIFSHVKNGGVSNYWYELISYLENQTNENIFFLENGHNVYQNFHRTKLKFPEDKIIQKNSDLIARINKIKIQENEKFIFHSSYYRTLSNNKFGIEVSTIHDFIHSYYSSFLKKKFHNYLKFNSLNNSKGIICISENTYKDLKKFYKVKKDQKVEIIYNGVSNDFYSIKSENTNQNIFFKRYNLQKKEYLLYIGGRTSYKNFNYVISMLNENKNLKLVIVGGGLLSKEELSLFNKDSLSRLTIMNSLENDELNFVYNNAKALLYPSSYEGFGIPIIEAMKAECPVIVLDTPISREIASNGAIYLKNLTLNSFKNSLLKLENNQFISEIKELGIEISKKYSWEKCTKQTHEFYKNLYETY